MTETADKIQCQKCANRKKHLCKNDDFLNAEVQNYCKYYALDDTPQPKPVACPMCQCEMAETEYPTRNYHKFFCPDCATSVTITPETWEEYQK
jgi:hypothetical protein